MNTDTTNGNGLGSAFGDKGTNVNSIVYGHPHGEKILREICEVLRESESGRLLLVLLDKNIIPVHIMKGSGESGFSPEMMTIFMQIPGKINAARPQDVIQFAKALDEAAQEHAGFKAPDPQKDLIEYASFIHARNLDSITKTLEILKELTNSLHFPVLLDSLKDLGLNDMYKAYLDGASREELYGHYADAYDKQIEGV